MNDGERNNESQRYCPLCNEDIFVADCLSIIEIMGSHQDSDCFGIDLGYINMFKVDVNEALPICMQCGDWGGARRAEYGLRPEGQGKIPPEAIHYADIDDDEEDRIGASILADIFGMSIAELLDDDDDDDGDGDETVKE